MTAALFNGPAEPTPDRHWFIRYRELIAALPADVDVDALIRDRRFEIERDGDLAIHYAPIEYVNRDAVLVVIGATPGLAVMRKALGEARRLIGDGWETDALLAETKRSAAFTGTTRSVLVKMLDAVAVHEALGLASSADLFEPEGWRLVHTTSAVLFPTTLRGRNYSGTRPRMIEHPMLRRWVITTLAAELQSLDDPLVLPVGKAANEALELLIRRGVVDRVNALQGVPHPADRVDQATRRPRVDLFLESGKIAELRVRVKRWADRQQRSA